MQICIACTSYCLLYTSIYDGVIKDFKTSNFIYLLLFFPAITSGPIDRSRRFDEDIDKIIPRDEYLELLGEGIYKILKGMVYKLSLIHI